MAIISVSVDEKVLGDLNKLQKSIGFNGRSETIRAGIKMLVEEEKKRDQITGRQCAVLLVVHADEYDDRIARIKHKCEDLIMAHLHNKIDMGKCVEMFLLTGNADNIRHMTERFTSDKRLDATKLIIL